MDALDFRKAIYQAIKSEQFNEKILYHAVCKNTAFLTHGFIFNTKDFNLSFSKYFIACYAMINNVEKLFILQNSFSDFNESIKQLKYYIAYFPLYGNSKNYDIYNLDIS